MIVYYTGRALKKLEDIKAYSIHHWGEAVARAYIEELQEEAELINPYSPSTRRRAEPFHMTPAGRHFMIYDVFGGDVYIVEVFGQGQDIEARIAEAAQSIQTDLSALRDAIIAKIT